MSSCVQKVKSSLAVLLILIVLPFTLVSGQGGIWLCLDLRGGTGLSVLGQCIDEEPGGCCDPDVDPSPGYLESSDSCDHCYDLNIEVDETPALAGGERTSLKFPEALTECPCWTTITGLAFRLRCHELKPSRAPPGIPSAVTCYAGTVSLRI